MGLDFADRNDAWPASFMACLGDSSLFLHLADSQGMKRDKQWFFSDGVAWLHHHSQVAFIAVTASALLGAAVNWRTGSSAIPLVATAQAIAAGCLLSRGAKQLRMAIHGWIGCSLAILFFYFVDEPCIGRYPMLPFLVGLPMLALLPSGLITAYKASALGRLGVCFGFTCSLFVFTLVASKVLPNSVGSGFLILIYLHYALIAFAVMLLPLASMTTYKFLKRRFRAH